MVAPTAPSPPLSPAAIPPPELAQLPALSPSDRTLLLRLLTADEDFPALAAQLTTESAPPSSPAVPCPLSTVPSDLLSLLSWSTQPPIAAWLTYYHTVQDHHSRRLAITCLESLVSQSRRGDKTSDSPVEQRRAATTLLRALDHKWPPSPRHKRGEVVRATARTGVGGCSPWPHSRDALSPPSPRYKRGEVSRGSASDGEGGCSPLHPLCRPFNLATLTAELQALTSPDTAPSASPDWPGLPPRPSASSAFSSPSAAPPIQNPQSKIQNPPAPSITPSPSHTPDTLAKTIAADLSSGDIMQVAATLAAISTDSLRADPDTLLDRLQPHLHLPKSAHISPPDYHKPTPPHRHACRIRLSHHSHIPTLGFARLHNQPWLLTTFDTG